MLWFVCFDCREIKFEFGNKSYNFYIFIYLEVINYI